MKIDSGKYNQNITLICPVCGNTEMEYEDNSDFIKCTSCGRETTTDELIEDNGESINLHVEEVKKELTKDFEKQMRDMLKKTFKGNKNIRIK
ncbi:Uncharacterised protein [Serratia entomophila]|uniref:ECs_2282 family putative zinc-binding protein n=1 Tax=Serratia entomophila TaxID=42906 RepID=UPI00217CAAC8|nr:hypothetical protein [Serratia entomophila]CAI0799367.1 Uncharacterised protein [Serratia entomophila]HEJ8016575.1 hypothetical protein [Serratia marcescens]HEJ8084525.1 hypothetical protein [Serratia marcescens]